MKMKSVILFFLLLCLAQLVIAVSVLMNIRERPLDTIAVNEIVQSVSLQWDELTSGEKTIIPFHPMELDFTVISNDGTVLAATEPGLSGSISEALAHRDAIIDIVYKSKNVGKVLINNRSADQRKTDRKNLLTVLLAASTLELLLLAGYFLYLNRIFFRPFNRLKAFAVHVAGGNFDYPLEMDRKNVFGAFTESFDLMREELKKARAQEQAASRSKKELVAKLSHDIKTPVASIKAVSELMAVSAKTGKEQKQLEVIREKADQIDRLVSNLFHAALEELQELSVTPSIQGSLRITDLLAASDYQNAAVMEDMPECMLVFDEMRLQQVFDNIFSNSYKYAESKINVRFGFSEIYLAVKIEDFGSGIPREELPLIFEKFYRGRNAAGKNGGGLGLFISRYLLTQMGGKISCENTENGFRVIVFLKLAGTS